MKIKAQPLTATAFQPYGKIMTDGLDLPMSDNEEITYWGKVSVLNIPGLISTGIMLALDREKVVTKMERHTKTAEILVALDGDSVVCVGTQTSDGSGIADIAVFTVRQGDAVALDTGIWHWAPFPCGTKPAKYIVIFANDTETSDMDFKETTETVYIES